jgi:hypothetical protein
MNDHMQRAVDSGAGSGHLAIRTPHCERGVMGPLIDELSNAERQEQYHLEVAAVKKKLLCEWAAACRGFIEAHRRESEGCRNRRAALHDRLAVVHEELGDPGSECVECG